RGPAVLRAITTVRSYAVPCPGRPLTGPPPTATPLSLLSIPRPPPASPLSPSTTLFRSDFGYTKITVERPLKDENGQPVLKKGKPDRKSTRLNSSHVSTSYAVFCLKKKKDNTRRLASLADGPGQQVASAAASARVTDDRT